MRTLLFVIYFFIIIGCGRSPAGRCILDSLLSGRFYDGTGGEGHVTDVPRAALSHSRRKATFHQASAKERLIARLAVAPGFINSSPGQTESLHPMGGRQSDDSSWCHTEIMGEGDRWPVK